MGLIRKVSMQEIKCQCPNAASVPPDREFMYSDEEKPGMNHEPGECKGTYKIRKYRRGKKEFYLCSCCTLPGDELLLKE